MARKILTLSVNQKQYELFTKLMEEVHQTNKSAFFVSLMANEETRRLSEQPKRGPGRPRKADASDTDEEEEVYNIVLEEWGRKRLVTLAMWQYLMRDKPDAPKIRYATEEEIATLQHTIVR